MTFRRMPLLRDKIALIQLAGDVLTQWERDRLAEWTELSFGSRKQEVVVDRIGARLYGTENWATYCRGVELRGIKR